MRHSTKERGKCDSFININYTRYNRTDRIFVYNKKAAAAKTATAAKDFVDALESFAASTVGAGAGNEGTGAGAGSDIVHVSRNAATSISPGTKTELITCTTPLVAMISVATIMASLTIGSASTLKVNVPSLSVVAVRPVDRASAFTSPLTTWYKRMEVKADTFSGSRRHSTSPAGRASKASSVGANTAEQLQKIKNCL